MSNKDDSIEMDLSQLDALAEKFPSVVDRAIQLVGQAVTREAKIEAPVKTGILKREIKLPENIRALAYTISIGVPYWRPVQYGSVPHEIVPKHVKALHFVWNGQEVFFKRVQHPGTKANPFLTRAINSAIAQVANFVAQAKGEAGY